LLKNQPIEARFTPSYRGSREAPTSERWIDALAFPNKIGVGRSRSENDINARSSILNGDREFRCLDTPRGPPSSGELGDELYHGLLKTVPVTVERVDERPPYFFVVLRLRSGHAAICFFCGPTARPVLNVPRVLFVGTLPHTTRPHAHEA
jgi:hypothetical protein